MPNESVGKVIDTLIAGGEKLLNGKDYRAAEAQWLQAIELATGTDYTDQLATAHVNMAMLRRLGSAFKQGLAQAKLAVKYAGMGNNHALMLKGKMEVAQNYQLLRNYRYAALFYKQAFTLATQLNDFTTLINIHMQLAWLSRSTGNMKDALQHAQQSLILIPQVNSNYWAGGAYMGMGVLCAETGMDDMAIDYHLLSISELEKCNVPQQVASALDNLAEVYVNRGQWQKAEEYKLKSFALRMKKSNRYIIMMSHLSMARLYANTGRQKQATEHLVNAEDIANDGYQQLLYEVYRGKAEACKMGKNWKQSIVLDKLYLKNRQAAGDQFDMAIAYHRMGECHIELKQFAQAEKFLQKALKYAGEQNASPQMEKIYQTLSAMATAQGKHKQALVYLQNYNTRREVRVNLISEYRIILLNNQFELDKKDIEIEKLKSQLPQPSAHTAPKDYKISPREKQVLKLLVAGESYKGIAIKLDITYETVRTHIKRLYEKLDVVTNTEAVAKAIKQGLVL